MIKKLDWDKTALEKAKMLVVGMDETLKLQHLWIETDVLVFGSEGYHSSPTLFDIEEKARTLFESIPPNFYHFKVEYLWLEHLAWQVEPIKKFLNEDLSEN